MRTPRILATPWTVTSWQTTGKSASRSASSKARKASRSKVRASGGSTLSFSIAGFDASHTTNAEKPTRSRRGGVKKGNSTKRRKRAA